MWTPFPLTTQLVGWVNLLEKCEGAYVIMMIRSSPHALPAALMVADCGRSKESGACGSLYKGKNTHRRHGEQVRGKGRGGDVNRFFLLLCTPNPSLTNDTVAPCKNKSAVRQSEAVAAHLQVVCLDA